MNTPKKSLKSIIIIASIIIVALIAYFYYEGSIAVSNSSLTSSAVDADAQQVGLRVMALLNQIKSLKIDTALFRDPSYSTLRDYSVAIPQQNVGRPNPFAPLPGMQASGTVRK